MRRLIMLRACDFLLTIAAAWLLMASLESPRRSRVIRASASDSDWYQANSGAEQTLASPSSQSQLKRLDLLMAKLRRNFDSLQQQQVGELTRPNNNSNNNRAGHQASNSSAIAPNQQNSYNFYANQTGNLASNPQQQSAGLKAGQENQFKRPQEVKIEFLRSSVTSSSNEAAKQQLVPHNNKRFKNGNLAKYQRPSGNSTQSLFMLNYQHILPQTMSLIEGQMQTSLHNSAGSNDLHVAASSAANLDSFEAAEQQQQQQQPPFTLFPQLQPQAQQGFSAPQAPILQDPRIRQMLSNYQRYGSPTGAGAPQLGDYQRQLLTQLNPRPQELHLRPPTASTGGQQPPGAPTSSQNAPSQQGGFSPLQLLGPLQAFLPAIQQQGQQQLQAPKSTGQTGKSTTADGKASTPATTAPQQAAAPFNLLDPFGLGGTQSGQQAGGPQRAPPANLQELYQQLPIYQALMAMRQRQEALQAAQRYRDPSGGAVALQPPRPHQQPVQQLPTPAPPLGGIPGAQPPPFAGLNPALLAGLPQGSLQQNPLQQQQQWNQQPINNVNGNGPVHFDDDQHQQPQQPARPQRQPEQELNNNNPSKQQENEDNNNHSSQDGNSQNHNNNNNNESNSEDHQEEPEQHHQGQSDNNNNNGGQGEQGGGQPEAEDPDLKQFQNFANGGDSFTDLFPPGILSNNDINEIKSEQDKQNKKQEQEERQKQQLAQQQPQQPPSSFQQSGGASDMAPNQPENPEQPDNVNQLDGEGEQNGQNENEKPEDGSSEEGGEGEQPEDNQENGGQPNAAALTSKSAAAAASQVQNTRQTSSPGVEYAKPA